MVAWVTHGMYEGMCMIKKYVGHFINYELAKSSTNYHIHFFFQIQLVVLVSCRALSVTGCNGAMSSEGILDNPAIWTDGYCPIRRRLVTQVRTR